MVFRGRGFKTARVAATASKGTSRTARAQTNSEVYWRVRREFAAKYASSSGQDQPAPTDKSAFHAQVVANFEHVMGVLRPTPRSSSTWPNGSSTSETRCRRTSPGSGSTPPRTRSTIRATDSKTSAEMYAAPAPRSRTAPRSPSGAPGSTPVAHQVRATLFMVMSADLAESTNIALRQGHRRLCRLGLVRRKTTRRGVLCRRRSPSPNAAITCGIASVNLSSARSTRGRGSWRRARRTVRSPTSARPMRLFAQLAQDSQIKVGKVLWIAATRPRDAEDAARTSALRAVRDPAHADDHVATCTVGAQRGPGGARGRVASGAQVLALHLTRPAIDIPDRAALGMPSHFAAARGAYVLRTTGPTRRSAAGSS